MPPLARSPGFGATRLGNRGHRPGTEREGRRVGAADGRYGIRKDIKDRDPLYGMSTADRPPHLTAPSPSPRVARRPPQRTRAAQHRSPRFSFLCISRVGHTVGKLTQPALSTTTLAQECPNGGDSFPHRGKPHFFAGVSMVLCPVLRIHALMGQSLSW